MVNATLYFDNDDQLARHRYVVGLLAHIVGLAIDLEVVQCGNRRPPGLEFTGGSTLSKDDLDAVFSAVTLQREIDSGLVDQMGRFDESRVSWDTSTPWIDVRVGELTAGLSTPVSIHARSPGLSVIITHDLDRVSGVEPTAILRNIGARVGRRGRGGRIPAATGARYWMSNVEKLLQLEVEEGVRAYYFFLSGPYGLRRYSSRYDINWPNARAMTRLIADAGMTIGLHGSYYARERDSYSDERRRLEDALGSVVTCHRNHYLRFDPARVWSQLERAGILHDFSIGFTNRIGFRAGTAHPYPTFDLGEGRATGVIAIPLLLMDTVLVADDKGDPLRELRRALGGVKEVGGCVALLFHPENFLGDEWLFSSFKQTLQICRDMGADLSGRLPPQVA